MDLIASFLEPSPESRRVRMQNNTLDVGRDPSSGLILDHPSVSRKHALIKAVEGKSHFTLEDRRSSNGSTIDGIPVNGASVLHSDQVVGIGPFRFRLCAGPETPVFDADGAGRASGDGEPEERLVHRAMNLLPELTDALTGNETLTDEELNGRLEKALYPRVLEMLPEGAELELAGRVTEKVLKQVVGLGPLEQWIRDPSVSEIMINGIESAYLEREGKLIREEQPFQSEQAITRVIERITAPLGRRVDESSPYVDGRLADGSRVNAVVPPVSLTGPVLTIRKFASRRMAFDDLVAMGTLTEDSADLLSHAVRESRNILVSGGTGTGKTTFLNALAEFIPSDERVVTIEDAAELDLAQDHVIRLETRPPNVEGLGEITARDLVRNSLRMRPDRIIVGECRGAEALDMLQAMNTGHEGSMTTCHANSPRDALKRIETMALMSGLELPHSVIREQVASAIHLIVQLVRLRTGRRRVSHILEVDRLEGSQILTQDLFLLDGSLPESGLTTTGLKPSWAGRPDQSRRDREWQL